ncbi:MAG: cysteine desulfurase [Oscillospiraceae bacterium]|nr:cysteine desulfurase [Oscillospiraceae bacterium]
MIYLDYAASAPIYELALQKMYSVTFDNFASPSAIHSAGSKARKLLNDSRQAIASLLGVRDREVFFTSGATEANNWAVRSACSCGKGNNIVVSALEHKSILAPVEAMKAQGYTVTRIYPDANGVISPEALDAVMTADTCLVCVQSLNNETGVIQDVAAIADVVHRYDALYMCDAAQSFGHTVQPLHRADLITISAHKFGGPKGIGCLVMRYPNFPKPMLLGGGQELGMRSGTENVPAIAAFALAAQLSSLMREEERIRLNHLSTMLVDAIKETDPSVELHSEGADRYPAIINLRFPGIAGEQMVALLDLEEIYASPGAACTARDSAPSHVLMAMGCSEQHARESVRFSIGRLTTPREIETASAAICRILRNLKGL